MVADAARWHTARHTADGSRLLRRAGVVCCPGLLGQPHAMTHMTVHIDGSGALILMDLDAWQMRGDACAYCPQTAASRCTRVGKVVNGDVLEVCAEHCSKV